MTSHLIELRPLKTKSVRKIFTNKNLIFSTNNILQRQCLR